MFPAGNEFFRPIIFVVYTISCMYGALLALVQYDLRKAIAYSSVYYMSLAVAGVFSNTVSGILGSFLLTISHAFVLPGLFIIAGTLHGRYRTKLLDCFSSLI